MTDFDNENPHVISIAKIDIDPSQQHHHGKTDTEHLPILMTRNLVLFPQVVTPLSLVREQSRAIAKQAFENGTSIGVVCQSNPSDNEPTLNSLQPYGVVADVLQIIDLPNGVQTAILSGRSKFEINSATETPDGIIAQVTEIKEQLPQKGDKTFSIIVDKIKEITLEAVKDIEGSMDFVHNVQNIPTPVGLVNFICSQVPIPGDRKLTLLAENSLLNRANALLRALSEMKERQLVTQEIMNSVRQHFEQNQKQAFLQQQMETIRQELYGDSDDERDALRKRAESVDFTPEAQRHFDKEVDKLMRLNPGSPDYGVQFTYLETLLDLPWNKYSPLNSDLKKAREILDNAHYGLKKVKERILEQIAVLMHNPSGRSPIICLVGPPGVGKTSLGRSVAQALGRSYQRVSLGGLHDEAEIRGHRRTYIGAMPGRIMDAIKRAGDSNPVLLLDEVDKIGSDFKGDPSAALLEVLDPEQNCRFHDNYIDIDYDLSKVLFIATANTLSTLSQPLLDRMEIIDLSGYIIEEKIQIARNHIIPSLRKEHLLKAADITFTPEAIATIIEGYTSESGVRQLEKAIASIIRKTVMTMMLGDKHIKKVGPSHIASFLGAPRYNKDRYEGNDFTGVVTGLAWTAAGGEILFIESSLSKTKGEKLILTGNLGNVMKESAAIARQYVVSHADQLGIAPELFDDYQLHIHVPEGAIPKDGPSAGITMATSIASAYTGRKIRPRLAMTGELTLRGKVLPVGGIKEKIIAAKRAGITDIILCSDNRKDIIEIDPIYIEGLTFHYVDTADQVLNIALL